MVWWITTLKWVFGILGLGVATTAFFMGLAFITNEITKRRYKPENDIGRQRQDFSTSFSGSGETSGIRMDKSSDKRGLLQNTETKADGTDEQDIGGDREEPRVPSHEFTTEDYDKFKREFLN